MMRKTTQLISIGFGALVMAMPLAPVEAATPPAPPLTSSQSQPDISHMDIQKTGRALRKVLAIQSTYRGELVSATSQQEREKLRSRAIAEETDAVHSEGLTVSTYTTVLKAARNNPAIRQEVLRVAHLESR